jgi:hypothetical protein
MAIREVKKVTEQLKVAPIPPLVGGRSRCIYQIVESLGGRASLNQILKMTPASDLSKQPKDRIELRKWISSSCTSKGYLTQISEDVFGIATYEEYREITGHNRAVHLKWLAKQKKLRQKDKMSAHVEQNLSQEIMPPRAPNPTKPTGRPVGRPPKTKPVKFDFVQQYVGALLGTTTAIALFFVMLRIV